MPEPREVRWIVTMLLVAVFVAVLLYLAGWGLESLCGPVPKALC